MEIDTSGFFNILIQAAINNLDSIIFMQYFLIIYCYIDLLFLENNNTSASAIQIFFLRTINSYDLSKKLTQNHLCLCS